MKQSLLNKISIGNEKTGIGMIVSSLVVIIFMVAAFLYQQKSEDSDDIQHQGAVLVRLLSSMSVSQLSGEKNMAGALRLLQEARVNQNFAYAAVVDVTGQLISEVTKAGIEPMPMELPRQPSHWIGERQYILTSGAVVNEYFAPIMENGDLRAFIRLGFLEPGFYLNSSQARLLAILAMAIFMLTPIFYFLLKNELKPLASIGTQLQGLVNKTDIGKTDVTHNTNTLDLMEKFSTVVETAYNHINTLEEKQTNSVVSSKLLVYQKTRLESALNALPTAILVVDESGQLNYVSKKMHRFLGTNSGEVLGCNVTDFCDNRELSEYLASCLQNNAANMHQRDEADIFIAETDTRVLVNAYPLYSHKEENQLIGTVFSFRDGTYDATEKKQNGEFIAHVAHELKTPLNILYMYSESLLDSIDESKELTIEAANVIHDETGRISQMIDNLLNLSMIEMGTVPIHRQRVKVGDLLEDIYENMSHNKQTEALDFKLNIPHDLGALSLDKDLVRVSINNLISNAVKYNEPGGKVELSADENDKEIIIRVSDSGIGISERDQHRVFSKFFRSDDEEVRKRSGHGLGLSLVHETVKLHHGKIQVNSECGKGSEFIISFAKESNMLKDVI